MDATAAVIVHEDPGVALEAHASVDSVRGIPGTGCSGSRLLPGVPGTPVLVACSRRRELYEMCTPVWEDVWLRLIKGIFTCALLHSQGAWR